MRPESDSRDEYLFHLRDRAQLLPPKGRTGSLACTFSESRAGDAVSGGDSRALQTSNATFEMTMKLCGEGGEEARGRHRLRPASVSNRVLMPLINEAAFCVMEWRGRAGGGGCRGEEARNGSSHGAKLELADFIGLDVCLDVMEVLFDGFGDPKFRPCPLLKKMVSAGWLGKKSGRGFVRL